MRAVAARAYGEMAAAGYGAVGEFHYVHHLPGGRPYEDPNALAVAVAEAGAAAGLTVVLLPAAYHRAGWDGGDLPPTEGQRRFCDPTVGDFLGRVDGLREWVAGRPAVRVGVAAHSVRAVPAEWLTAIAEYADTPRPRPPRARGRAAPGAGRVPSASTAARRWSCSSAPASWASARA